jgi:hypothetical protein
MFLHFNFLSLPFLWNVSKLSIIEDTLRAVEQPLVTFQENSEQDFFKLYQYNFLQPFWVIILNCNDVKGLRHTVAVGRAT